MKKILLILPLFISLTYATHVKWQGDYEDALKMAIVHDKILMVLLIKNNCNRCKDIVTNIFTNKPYIDKINKNIVAVIVNKDNKHSYPIEMYWSNNFPTLFFVNSKNELFLTTPLDTNLTTNKIKSILDKVIQE